MLFLNFRIMFCFIKCEWVEGKKWKKQPTTCHVSSHSPTSPPRGMSNEGGRESNGSSCFFTMCWCCCCEILNVVISRRQLIACRKPLLWEQISFFSIESHQFFPNDVMPEYSQMQESLVIKAIFRKLSCCHHPLSYHYASATTSYESANTASHCLACLLAHQCTRDTFVMRGPWLSLTNLAGG